MKVLASMRIGLGVTVVIFNLTCFRLRHRVYIVSQWLFRELRGYVYLIIYIKTKTEISAILLSVLINYPCLHVLSCLIVF